MSGHVHAELMAQYAEDARETVAPWERWEVQDVIALPGCVDGWRTCDTHPSWSQKNEYRRKPKTSRERFHEWRTSFAYPLSDEQEAWAAWQEAERQARELDE